MFRGEIEKRGKTDRSTSLRLYSSYAETVSSQTTTKHYHSLEEIRDGRETDNWRDDDE